VALTLVASAVPANAALAATTPAKLYLVASSHDGAAFDFDEYVDGDVSVQVTSSVKGPVNVTDSRDLKYFWTFKAFGSTAAAVRIPSTGTTTQPVDVAGKFVAPLPVGHGSGSYTLTATISGTSTATPISGTVLKGLKAGNASTTFVDASPLRTDPGADRSLSGALKLEDGTGLPGRLIDLGITRGTEGSDPEADAGFLAAPGEPILDALQVTTVAAGKFTAILTDPAEDGQGTELGDVIEASTAPNPDIGDAAAAPASLAVDFVTNDSPPAGTTAIVDPLGGGTPGQAFASALTITAPDDTFDVDPTIDGVQGDDGTDRDPVEGQVYSMSLDHGFFTTGIGAQPSVVGAAAGDLEQLGTTLSGITGPDGLVAFQVGMGRDEGFDDDGKVTATLTALVGGVTQATSATWDSTSPLNGHVLVTLSTQAQQDNPVDPAVAGDRAYYDVLALDQFGNRAGVHLIDLTYGGDTDNWDYSDDSTVSDFTATSDIWLTSFDPATVSTTGTWVDAPTTLYVDNAGNSAPGTATTSNTTSTSFYEVDFDASTFTLTSSATDVVKVGTAVTQTVRVVDQLGNPVRGYEVQFFRYGPNLVSGDVIATGTTNARGEASYTFVGNTLGSAVITAQVTNGLSTRELTVRVRFGSAITARLASGTSGSSADHLTVSASPAASGAQVKLYRVVSGTRHLAATGKLSRNGNATFLVGDRNGNSYTTYIALVQSTSKTVADYSNTARLR